MMKSTCAGRSPRPTADAEASGTRTAVSLSSVTARPRVPHHSMSRRTTVRAPTAFGLATIPTRFITPILNDSLASDVLRTTGDALGQCLHGARDQTLDVHGRAAMGGRMHEELAIALGPAQRRRRR